MEYKAVGIEGPLLKNIFEELLPERNNSRLIGDVEKNEFSGLNLYSEYFEEKESLLDILVKVNTGKDKHTESNCPWRRLLGNLCGQSFNSRNNMNSTQNNRGGDQSILFCQYTEIMCCRRKNY